MKRFWLDKWKPDQPLGLSAERLVRGEEFRPFDVGGKRHEVLLVERTGGWKWMIYRWTDDGQKRECIATQQGFGDHRKTDARRRAEYAARAFAKDRCNA